MIHTIIVEDDPMVAQIHRQYLEKLNGFNIDGIFNDGNRALDYLEKHPNDLIILDIYMPTMTGLQLLRKLRSIGIKSSVIMVTAAMETKVIGDALELGIVDYLIKPFSYERFHEAISRYLSKRQLLKNKQVVDQAELDRLMNSNLSTKVNITELSKGLNKATLDIITEQLQKAGTEKCTCESLSQACNLSKVTIRRYLNYLIDIGKVENTIDYETGGRPRTLYFLKY